MRELAVGIGAGEGATRGSARADAGPRATRGPRAVPADGLLHPAALLALGLLLLNDHVLKRAWPGFVTGKLSDVAGLVVFPLFLVGAAEVVLWLAGRWRAPDERVLTTCVALTAVVFTLVKTLPIATEAYQAVWGLLQWLPAWIGASLAGGASPEPWHVQLAADATDLLCLPAVLIPLWLGRRRGAEEAAT